jgi:hypothetical protein
MRAALQDSQDIIFDAINDAVHFINASAPPSLIIVFKRLRLAYAAAVAVTLDIF